jgi:hypothetical protein
MSDKRTYQDFGKKLGVNFQFADENSEEIRSEHQGNSTIVFVA